MKRLLLILLLGIAATAQAQKIKAYTVTDILQRTAKKDSVANDTIYVVNIWATWCMPCVAELHEFNTFEKKFEGRPVKVILVSLEFTDDYRGGKLDAFVQRKHLTPEVVWLNETDPNEFIPAIDKSWGGSIPATLMLYPAKGQRQFLEGPITAGKLKHVVDKWLE